MDRTLDVIAYDLLSTIRQLHDDSDIDLRQVKYWIRSSRAVWLTNELNKFKPVSPEFIQDLGCVELVTVDASLCSTPIGCNLLRTALEIPVFLEAGNEPAITRVGPAIVNLASFKVIPYERVKYIGSGRFNADAIYAFLLDRYIWLVTRSKSLNYSGMRKINIRGVLAHPEDAERFTKGDGTPCYDSTSNYPMTDRLVTYMKDMIVQSDIKTLLTLLPDRLNNAADDSAGQPGIQEKRPEQVQV
jgi:hypothetical protein